MSSTSRGNARLSKLYGLVLRRVHWLNAVAKQQRQHEDSKVAQHQKLYRRSGVTEALEPRVLLASDFTFDASSQSKGINAVLSKDNTNILLKEGNTVLSSQAIANSTKLVTITGSGYDDTLGIDASMADYTVSFAGGDGLDKLLGPNTANTWQMEGPDSGNLNSKVSFTSAEEITGGTASDTLLGVDEDNEWEVTGKNTGTLNSQFKFSAIENLSGGDQIDQFMWGEEGELTGHLDGKQGRDVLDYTSYTDAITVTYDSNGSLNTTATKIGGNVTGMHEFVGGENTQDTLVGQRYDSKSNVWLDTLWTVEGDNEGRIDFLSTPDSILFSGFENLTGGKSNRDTFWIRDDGTVTGVIDGGGVVTDGNLLDDADSLLLSNGDENNALVSARQQTLDTVTLSGKAIKFKDIEPIIGGTADNRLITGSAVNDSFAIELTNDDTSKVHLLSLRNDFVIPAFDSSNKSVNGTIERNLTFDKPKTIELSLGAGDDRFGVFDDGALTSSSSTPIEFDGGSGTNTLVANNESHVWKIQSRNKGTLEGANNSVAYENVQFLLGGERDDTFTFSKGGSVDGGVDGGFGGENTLDYSDLGTNDPVEITLNVSNTNITNVIGTASDTDNLVGLPFSNTWVINEENKGQVSSKEIVERALDKQAVVDSAANLITFGDYVHEYATGDKVTYSTDLTSDSSGLKTGTQYYVVVPDAHSLKLSETYVDGVTTNQEEWSVADRKLLFDSKELVLNVAETGTVIKFQHNHNFVVGDDDGKLVKYDVQDDKDDDSGLIDGNEYYVIVLDSKRIQLLNATAKLLDEWTQFNVTRELVDPSDASKKLTFSFDNLTIGADTLKFDSAHGLSDGAVVKYKFSSTDSNGVDRSGLVDGVEYEVERIDDKNIRLRNPKPKVQSVSSSADWSTGTSKLRYEETLGNVKFQKFENLTGGNAGDAFTISGEGKVTGRIDGGDELSLENSLDLSNAKDVQPHLIDLSGSPKGGRLAVTNIDSIIGSKNTQDKLYGATGSHVWTITEENKGQVSGVSFAEIENLVGADSANDGFLIEKSGNITGVIDGGVGGGDNLTFTDGEKRFFVIPTGPQQPVIKGADISGYDGVQEITIAGIENPISVDTVDGVNVFKGSSLDESFSLSGNTSGYVFQNTNPNDKYWDQSKNAFVASNTVVLSGPLKVAVENAGDSITVKAMDTKGHSVTIASAAVVDVLNKVIGGNITFEGDIETGGGDLTIEVGGTITVKAGVTLSTVDDTSPSGEDSSGDLKLLGKQVIIEDNAKIETIGRLDATKPDPNKIPASLGGAVFPQLRYKTDNSVIDFWDSNTVYSELETVRVKAKKLSADTVVDAATEKITFPSNVSIDDVSTGDEFQYLTPLHDTTFAKSNVDGDANKITFSASPEFNVGDRVTYDNGGGQSIGGLDHGTDYFVIPDTFDDKVLQLATTREGAFDSDAIDLDTSEGDGNAHSLQAEFDSSGLIGDEKYFALKLDNKTIQLSTTKPKEQALESDKTKWAEGTRSLTAASDNFAKSDVDDASNKISFSAAPGFNLGDRVTYDNGGDTSIGELVNGTAYFVIPDTTNDKVLQLAATRQDAFDSKAIDLDPGTGAGSAHSLTMTQALVKDGLTVVGNAVEFNSKHDLSDGIMVKYEFVAEGGGSTDGSGLAHGTEYYVAVVNTHRVKLLSTAPDVVNLAATRPWVDGPAYLL